MRVETSAGPIHYTEAGTGKPMIFLHPYLTTGAHWRKVVPLLDGVRALCPTLPLGAHTEAMKPQADLTPPGLARIVVEFMDALEIPSATIVGNDTGGGIAQIVAANDPDRVAGLGLVSCDAYDVFPPRLFAYLKVVARIPGATWLLVQSMRLPFAPRLPIAFGRLTNEPIPREIMKTYVTPSRRSDIRRDLIKVTKGLHKRHTLAAAEKLRTFNKPVLVAWGSDDKVFPRRLAERLVKEFPDATLEVIEGAGTLVPEDGAEALAGRLSVERAD